MALSDQKYANAINIINLAYCLGW